jgi:hypothetical protein
MQVPSGRDGRRLIGIGRSVRQWAKEERGRSWRVARALDDFAAALEQHARLSSFALVACPPAIHDKASFRP